MPVILNDTCLYPNVELSLPSSEKTVSNSDEILILSSKDTLSSFVMKDWSGKLLKIARAKVNDR